MRDVVRDLVNEMAEDKREDAYLAREVGKHIRNKFGWGTPEAPRQDSWARIFTDGADFPEDDSDDVDYYGSTQHEIDMVNDKRSQEKEEKDLKALGKKLKAREGGRARREKRRDSELVPESIGHDRYNPGLGRYKDAELDTRQTRQKRGPRGPSLGPSYVRGYQESIQLSGAYATRQTS